MATGTPPKFLPTLTEVISPLAHPVFPSESAPASLPDITTELLENVRAQVRAELQTELQLLAMSSAQAHLDALLPLIDRYIETATHEVLTRSRRQ